jgi:hypothetical protein
MPDPIGFSIAVGIRVHLEAILVIVTSRPTPKLDHLD